MGTQVFVANLPVGVEKAAVRKLFAEYGEPVAVRMLRIDGCAFVRFSSACAADAATENMDGVAMNGARLRVQVANLL
ncbi:RNA-binding protein [Candidatus Poribacteria bacterium]|jgi:RNA recognition motif-containing protein|nr:RNA-binding protein [Candidatus Poribacteria bacterium]